MMSKEPILTLGIDPSFTAPGFALMRGRDLVDSFCLREGKEKGSIGDRLLEIRMNLVGPEFQHPRAIDLVSVERISVGKTSFEIAKKMAYVEAIILMWAQENDIPLISLHSSTARMHTFGKGKGNMKKKEVTERIRAEYGEDLSPDECDAIVVAIAGQVELGYL